MAFSPPPTANEVDRLYRQLMEIHTTGATLLVECARWRRSDSTPSPSRARASRQGLDEVPSTPKMTTPLPTNFSPKLRYSRTVK
jgi:hypothetical protein